VAIKVKVDADAKQMRRFHAAVSQLAAMTGKDFEAVIRGELTAVLNNTVRSTPKASVAKIRNRHDGRLYTRRDGKTYKLSNNYPSALWDDIKARRARSLKRKLDARGLAASAWVKIGDRLRLGLKAPAYVRNAKSSGAPVDSVITTTESGAGAKYQIGFLNALTKMNKALGLGYIFRRALSARANYFSRSVKLEATKKIKRVLDRYPGMGRVS
jgi:hypothetical protein